MLRIGPNIQSIINAEIITASPSHFVGHYTVLIYPLAFFFAKELLIKSQVHFKNGCISVQKKNQKNNKKNPVDLQRALSRPEVLRTERI